MRGAGESRTLQTERPRAGGTHFGAVQSCRRREGTRARVLRTATPMDGVVLPFASIGRARRSVAGHPRGLLAGARPRPPARRRGHLPWRAGTTLAALAAGRPLVLVLQGADQFLNATACARGGVALVLSPGAFGPRRAGRARRTAGRRSARPHRPITRRPPVCSTNSRSKAALTGDTSEIMSLPGPVEAYGPVVPVEDVRNAVVRGRDEPVERHREAGDHLAHVTPDAIHTGNSSPASPRSGCSRGVG